jgi:predicted AlkP superfamily pyrophosphatase or phosphodiesterase
VKKFLTLFILAFVIFSSQAQTIKRPKLVIGIVVDQMRWDYLYRYSNRYTADGFNRFISKGFSCENTMIPYTPTYTAAGHACIYTGSVPAIHGILGNNWYSRKDKKVVYCTDDKTVKTIGSSSKEGLMSPENLWVTTITDELRLATNFKSKVIGIAIKDRTAIIPAGHAANAAYWFDNTTGGWITSSYYMNDLPQWVKDVNAKKLPDSYMSKDWNTIYPMNTYSQSTEDNKPYENDLGKEDNTFPHETSKISAGIKYEVFRTTPFGNTFTIDMAKAAIENEQLGQTAATDFLTISLSSTDYIGHAFGPNSVEAEDCYLRLDKDLATFFTYLDAKIGKGSYILFLTADHGAAHVPAFMKEHKIPAGFASDADIKKSLNDEAEKKFGVRDIITSVINYQLYLNYDAITSNKLDTKEIKQFLIQQLLSIPAISNAIDLLNIETVTLPSAIKSRIVNGYNATLSGDIQFIFKPQWFDGSAKGTTHGVWNPYDSHIPLLWYGWNIKSGKTNKEVYMTDISATIAALLHIQMPNGCIGKPIEGVTQ